MSRTGRSGDVGMQASPFGVPGKREDQLVYRLYSRDSVRMLLRLDFVFVPGSLAACIQIC